MKRPTEKELRNFIETLFEGAGKKLSESELGKIKIEFFENGETHNPANFTNIKGNCACYMFYYEEEKSFLKIGKVTSTNSTRYKSYHYQIKPSISSLAKSLSESDKYGLKEKCEKTIGDWIKDNCTRINILIPEDIAIKWSGAEEGTQPAAYENFFLNLLEAGLHFKYKPVFEGRCK